MNYSDEGGGNGIGGFALRNPLRPTEGSPARALTEPHSTLESLGAFQNASAPSSCRGAASNSRVSSNLPSPPHPPGPSTHLSFKVKSKCTSTFQGFPVW